MNFADRGFVFLWSQTTYFAFPHHKIWSDFSWSQNKYFMMSAWPKLSLGCCFFSFFLLFISFFHFLFPLPKGYCEQPCNNRSQWRKLSRCGPLLLSECCLEWVTDKLIYSVVRRDCCLAEWAVVLSLKWEEYFAYGAQSKNRNTSRWVFPNYLWIGMELQTNSNTTHINRTVNTKK